MKEKTCYTNEPLQMGRVLSGFLPAPDRLVFREDSVKVTISLSAKSVQFFKTEAAKRGVQYQRMIRRLLDAYVEAFAPAASSTRQEGAKGHRIEQSGARYRKGPRRA